MYASDFENFKHPSRKPWLVVLALIVSVATGWFVYRHFETRKQRTEIEPPVPEKKTTVSGEYGSVSLSAPTAATNIAVPASTTGKSPTNAVALPVRRVLREDSGDSLAKAKAFESAGEFVKARQAYLSLLKHATDSKTITDAERCLGMINVKLVTAPLAMPEKTEYIVKQGDSLDKIAKAHGTTVEAVKNANRISNPALIRKGDRLLILTGKFAIRVSK
jgi:LysM repeat protein